MSWHERLKAKGVDVKFGVAGKKAARKKTPRDAVLATIDNSIALRKNSQFVVSSGKGAGKPPATVFEISGSVATIRLPYRRTRLKLLKTSDQATVDVAQLDDALDELRADVAAGKFDKQLAKLVSPKAGVATTTGASLSPASSTAKTSKPSGTTRTRKPKKP